MLLPEREADPLLPECETVSVPWSAALLSAAPAPFPDALALSRIPVFCACITALAVAANTVDAFSLSSRYRKNTTGATV